MDGTVIPLSAVRAHRGSTPREEVAVLSIELHRREPDGGGSTSLGDDIRRKVHDRCIRAALVVAGRRGASLSLAGTSAHPVVDARFHGDGAALSAADAAVEIGHAVREAQRTGERAIVIGAAIGTGSRARTAGGIAVTSGAPGRVAERLRERARPGELLLGGSAAEPVAAELRADAAAAAVIDPSIGTVPVWRMPITSHPTGTIE